jgi:HlyD family secretion protein/macrolide-specific efflux system membrane fusion protein
MFHSRGHCVRTDQGFHALVYLHPRQAASVHPGQPAEVTTHALPQVVLSGHVLTIAPPDGADGVAPSRGQHLVTVELTGTHPQLRHGMAVEVLITTSTLDDVLVVPNSAVIRHDGNFYVEVLEPTGERHHVAFTPGLIGHDTTQVLGGLAEGQEFILTPDPLP